MLFGEAGAHGRAMYQAGPAEMLGVSWLLPDPLAECVQYPVSAKAPPCCQQVGGTGCSFPQRWQSMVLFLLAAGDLALRENFAPWLRSSRI